MIPLELIGALAAGASWIALAAVLVLLVRSAFALTGVVALLAAYPAFCAVQVLLPRALGAAGLLATTTAWAAHGLLVGVSVLALYARRPRAGALRVIAPDLPPAAAPIAPAPDSAAAAEAYPLRRLVLAVIVVVVSALALFALLSPVHIWDALAYHAPMVASYIQNGSLEAWPTQDLRQVYRVNAGELQMLNVALLARSDAWIELPNLLALVVVLAATYEIARLALKAEVLPYLAVLLVLTAPQILVGSATAKNDLVFTAALMCAFYWVIRSGLVHSTRARAACLGLAGLSGALAGATKVMGLNVVGAAGLLALVLMMRRRLSFGHVALYTFAAVAGLLLLAGNVYLSNLTRSAVPVGIAPGEIHYSFGLINVREAAHFYLYDLPLRRLVTRPVFEHDFMHYGYLFPFMLIFGVVAAVAQIRDRRYVPACLALMGLALILSVIAVRRPISWDQRFMIWLVPTLAILALTRAERLKPRRVLQLAWIAVGLTGLHLLAALTLEADHLFPRSLHHLATTGTAARYIDVPNRKYAFMNEGFERVDELATSRDSILYVGTDDSWTYPAWGPRFTRHVEGVWNAEHAAAQVTLRTFRFIIIEDEAAAPLRAAAAERAASAGYAVLANATGRTIFVRTEPES